jgi:hypothetical protein
MQGQNKHVFERVSIFMAHPASKARLWFHTFEDIFGTQLRIRPAGQAPDADS